jgi:3',5'-cyclic AMP phosphodiesterase CpdA
MKILLITDIHYGEDTNYPKHGGDEYINSFGSLFEKFLPQIRPLISEHDLVVNLGDLIHESTAELDVAQYKKAMALFGTEKPVKHVAGNHDLNTLSRDQLAEILGVPKLYYSFDLGGYHHIVLSGLRDSKKEPHRIDPEQLDWLKGDLQKADAPTLVYCHYPLDEQDLDSNYYFREQPDKGRISNREEVRSIFESSGRVIAVFNGHLHFHNQESINDIAYVTVPAFTENNGEHEPKAECVSVSLKDKNVESRLIRLAVDK